MWRTGRRSARSSSVGGGPNLHRLRDASGAPGMGRGGSRPVPRLGPLVPGVKVRMVSRAVTRVVVVDPSRSTFSVALVAAYVMSRF